jgi:hypothetical protein
MLLSACGGSATSAPPTQQSPCPAGAPEAGVYQPDRLRVMEACAHAEGWVLAVVPEPDGDYHVWIQVDSAYLRLLNSEDHFQGRPALLAEITPDCEGQPSDSKAAAQCPRSMLKIPHPGDHIAINGPWVFDSNHGWNEIHPVDSITVLGPE